ncbi:MAG: Imm21 family immunity protein [Chloroflexota bacterium]
MESLGGPLVIMSNEQLKFWGGNDAKPEKLRTDYERACLIDDYLGTIRLNDKEVLVLGDDPSSTSWFSPKPLNRYEIIFVRWIYAPDNDSVQAALHTLDFGNFQFSGIEIDFNSQELILFDSVLTCDDFEIFPGHYCLIPTNSSRYQVDTMEFKTERIHLLLHGLKSS